jgi:hypothetical protein
MTSQRRTAHRVRSWSAVAGLTCGAVAAAMMSVATAPAARADDLTDIVGNVSTQSAASIPAADTTDDVLGQAIQDLTQGTSVLDAAPTADLSTKQAGILADQATLDGQLESAIPHLETAQDGLSASDQTFLADADEQLVSATQSMLSADQAFVAADQAGDLSGSGFVSTDLTLLEADLGFLSASWDAVGASLLAAFDPGIGSLLP